MKKFFAFAIAAATVLAVGSAALAVDMLGGKTVRIPGYAGLDITVSDIAAKWGDHIDSQYGTFNMIVGSPTATVKFSKDVTLNNMGAAAGAVSAGTAKPMSEMDGYYVYADDGTLYTIFVTTANTTQYQEASLNADTNGIVKGSTTGGTVTTPTSKPAKTGDETNLIVWGAVAVAAAAGILVIARRKKSAE